MYRPNWDLPRRTRDLRMRSASLARFHPQPSRPRPLATALAVVAPLALAIAAAAAPRPPAPASAPKAPRPVDFNRDVLPILSNNCFLCHGMDSNRRMAALRLDRPDAAVAKLPSGKTAIVPGDGAASELVARITATNALKMPPAASGKKLTPAQITPLRHWVAEGAHYA